MFLGVFEQSQDIVTNNDTLLSRENVLDTHVDGSLVGLRKRMVSKSLLAVAGLDLTLFKANGVKVRREMKQLRRKLSSTRYK